MSRNLSLRRKSAARLALVQSLYRLKMTEEAPLPEKLLADVTSTAMERREGDKEIFEEEPDLAFLKKLLFGILPELKSLTALLKEHLSPEWKLERMSPLLVSILQAGMYELKASPDLKTLTIIDEYTAIASGFFEENEVNFVHGILHKTAAILRV